MRAAVYVRVSTGLVTQDSSLENQTELFREYALRRDMTIVKVYSDRQSGTKNNRPGLRQLLDDCKEGKFDVILAKELARLARNGKLSYELRDICHENNVHIICLDGSIDSTTGNIQNFGIFAWLYENESNNASRRNKLARRTIATKGGFIGSFPTYGYELADGKSVVRKDDTPEIVKRIYKEYLDGNGCEAIAKGLTLDAVPTPSEVLCKKNASSFWHGSTVLNILKNRHYCGDLVQCKQEMISVTSHKRREREPNELIILKNNHEPIISRDLFEEIQQMLEHRSKICPAPRKYLFTNVLFCEHCSRGFWYKKNQKGYRCGGNLKHGDALCLNKKPVREKELELFVLESLRNLYMKLDEHSTTFTAIAKKQKSLLNHQIDELGKEISTINGRKLKYVNLLTDGVISLDELNEYRAIAEKEVSEILLKQQLLRDNLEKFEDQKHLVELRDKLKIVAEETNLKITFLNRFIYKITADLDGNIKIQYKFKMPTLDEEL